MRRWRSTLHENGVCIKSLCKLFIFSRRGAIFIAAAVPAQPVDATPFAHAWGNYFGGAATDDALVVLAGSAKTSTALPDFGWRISGVNSDGISVDQLPPPVPAGIAMYCFPLARYVIGNPCAEVGRRVCQRIFPVVAS